MDKKRKKKVVKRLDKARATGPQMQSMRLFNGPLRNIKAEPIVKVEPKDEEAQSNEVCVRI